MFKKIVVGGVVVALIAVLVAGAVNWTRAKQGETDVLGQGRTAEVVENGRGGGWWKDGATSPASPNSGEVTPRGGGRGNQNLSNPGAGQAPATGWQTLSGVVQSVDETTLVVKLDAGATVDIASRAWSYAQQMGFAARPGDKVSLYGFYEGSAFESATIDNLTSGDKATLRDTNGRPMWAGRGRSS